jgi:hypothetical protein
MANYPPFATLNHFAADLGIPRESKSSRVGISTKLSEYLLEKRWRYSAAFNITH